MIAVQGTYDNGVVELHTPAPMPKANVLIIFPDNENSEKNVAVKDEFIASRFGVAKGKFVVPDDIDVDNDEIAKLFEGDI